MTAPTYAVEAGWLVEVVNRHTCGAGDVHGHEPGCGLEPVAEVSKLLAALHAVTTVRAQLLTCTCNTGPATEGPERDCPEHGDAHARYFADRLRAALDPPAVVVHYHWTTAWPHALEDPFGDVVTDTDPAQVTCEACRHALGSQQQDPPDVTTYADRVPVLLDEGTEPRPFPRSRGSW